MFFLNKKILFYTTAFFLIIVLYFTLRLPQLTVQPIFADEAIYIRWAQVMKAEATLRFLPSSDGKTPLFMWAMIPLFKFIKDPLLAGRLLSILSGFGTLAGIFFLGWKFFNTKVGLWAGFLLAITPFMIFFDRMALVDSMLAAFSIWSLNLALLLVKYQRLDVAMFLGYSLGGGLLTKPSALFNILALPSTLIILDWRDKVRQSKLLRLFGLWLVTFLITFVIYSILRLGPGFDMINSRNQDYVFSPFELIGRPLDPFLPHFNDVKAMFYSLLTWPILVLVIIGVSLALVKKNMVALVVLVWSLVPMVLEMAFLKTFTARYILSSIPPLLLLAGWAISEILQKVRISNYIKIPITVFLIIVLPIIFASRLWDNSIATNLPVSEEGYYRGWTAGYGLKDLADYLDQQSTSQDIVVGTQGSFGTLPDGLQIYLNKNRRVTIIGGGPNVSAQLRNAALEHPTYFVANRTINDPTEADLELIRFYPKSTPSSISKEAILLYHVLPNMKLQILSK